jgi:ribose 1,5-bisphosphokinase
MRGTLFLVVGPSGVGKDTLMRAALRARPDLHAPRRVVTRAADAGGEDIVPVTGAEFERMAGEGAFLLHWRAQRFSYGIPAAAGEALAAGRDVLVNVSRSVVDEARARLQPVRVLAVTASQATLAARLAARGRESRSEIGARLDRAGYAMPEGPDVTVIRNDGALGDAVAAFVDALQPVRG